jgi:hypothetical protein
LTSDAATADGHDKAIATMRHVALMRVGNGVTG